MGKPARGIRSENRERLEAAILTIARRHLGEVGGAGLSLRAIARELGMASSAVYRYVASRDELLTRLIVESFTALGDAAERAEAAVPGGDVRERFLATGRAVREWGVAHPFDWALLFGSPVPGYAAPGDRTTPAGTRVQFLLLRILADMAHLGMATAPNADGISPAARASAAAIADDLGPEIDIADLAPELLLAGIDAWTLLIAGVSREVFGHLGEIADAEELYESTLRHALSLVVAAPAP